jgi:hypothetical protein
MWKINSTEDGTGLRASYLKHKIRQFSMGRGGGLKDRICNGRKSKPFSDILTAFMNFVSLH